MYCSAAPPPLPPQRSRSINDESLGVVDSFKPLYSFEAVQDSSDEEDEDGGEGDEGDEGDEGNAGDDSDADANAADDDN